MPSIPPSDEPALPKLRRFRFDPEDPKVAREVFRNDDVRESRPPAPAEAPAGGAEPAEDPRAARGADPAEDPRADGGAHPAEDLRVAERLLAGLDGAVSGPRAPADPTPPTPVPAASPHTAPVPRVPHAAAGSTPPPAAAPKRRVALPYLIAGFAAALVIGIVAWVALRPAAEGAERSTQQAGEATEPAAVSWATDVCTLITEFQTASMPLRAVATQLSENDPDNAAVTDLQREAGKLLSTLAADLQSVTQPEDSAGVSAAHSTIVGAVNVAAATATSGAGAPIGTPTDASTIRLTLDRPQTVFQQAVAEMPTAERETVSAQQACTSLL